MEDLIDLIATDTSAAEVSDQIKNISSEIWIVTLYIK
jgi:hypothetical protein